MLSVDKKLLINYPQIEGLYIMGSRADEDAFLDGSSDIDCCAVLSVGMDYQELYKIVTSAISEKSRVEVCPRTLIQLKEKCKFNYDLKYRSKTLYIKQFDARLSIPDIQLKDFAKRIINSILFAALEYWVQSTFQFFHEQNTCAAIIQMEKSLRNLSLYINLRCNSYPKSAKEKNSIICMLYPSWRSEILYLSGVRQNEYYDINELPKTIYIIMIIMTAELQLLSEREFRICKFAAKDLRDHLSDMEHFDYVEHLINIYLNLYISISEYSIDTNIIIRNNIQNTLHESYYPIISQDSFSPPQLVEGGYHVYK